MIVQYNALYAQVFAYSASNSLPIVFYFCTLSNPNRGMMCLLQPSKVRHLVQNTNTKSALLITTYQYFEGSRPSVGHTPG